MRQTDNEEGSRALRPTEPRREQLGALESGLAALKAKLVAAARRQLTTVQVATFDAFLAEVTLESLGAAE